jgi:hypothetical protein
MRIFWLFFLPLVALDAACQHKENRISENEVVLYADANDGHDPQWTSRPYYSQRTWGIIGSGKVEEGKIWFNEFPGESSEYLVFIDGILEQDGSPHYALYSNDTLLSKGHFPYPSGVKDCNARGKVGDIPLGKHFIEKGSKITFWGKSVYECGKKGAYTLWYSLRFVKAKPSETKK